MHKLFKPIILAFALACTCEAFASGVDTIPGTGMINFGPNGSNFSVLTKGDMTTSVDNTFTGPSLIVGNVGIGGNGTFNASDGDIYGDLYMNSVGTYTTSGPFKLHGTKHNNADATLNAALSDANMLASAAGMENATMGNYTVNGATQFLTTVNTGKSMTIAANPFNGNKVVLNLTDFVLTNGTFTLQAGANSTFIINVTRNFSINNSSVILSGGIMSSNVLFNVKGTGSQVSLNQGVNLYGNLVAMNRKVDLSGGRVHGRVFANQFAITSGGQVVSE